MNEEAVCQTKVHSLYQGRMYLIPICDGYCSRSVFKEEEPYEDQEKLSTTDSFVKVHRENPIYVSYKWNYVCQSAKYILQTQAYLLYQWCVIRARVEHPHRLKKLNPAFSKVKPWNFVIEEKDILLYVKDPRFLWRFSMNNYLYFYLLLTKGIIKHNTKYLGHGKEVLSYNEDQSQLVPYYITWGGLLENRSRNFLHMAVKEGSKWYRRYDFAKLLHQASSYELSDMEKLEFKHSYDYYLQMIEPQLNYDDFVRILITGHTIDDAGPLLKLLMKQEAEFEKDQKNKLLPPGQYLMVQDGRRVPPIRYQEQMSHFENFWFRE